MLMLAGNTATKSAMSPHAAQRRVFGISTPMPPRISNAPLIQTSQSGAGSHAGTMRTNGSGLAKCAIPIATIPIESRTSAIFFQRGIVMGTARRAGRIDGRAPA